MIHSLNAEIQKSYIGYDMDIPTFNLFMLDLNSREDQEKLNKVAELIDLPWIDDTVDIIVKSIYSLND